MAITNKQGWGRAGKRVGTEGLGSLAAGLIVKGPLHCESSLSTQLTSPGGQGGFHDNKQSPLEGKATGSFLSVQKPVGKGGLCSR